MNLKLKSLSAPSRIVTVLLGSLLTGAPAFADVQDEWTQTSLAATRANSSTPTRASRHYAMTHVVIYDVVNGFQRTHRPYAHQATAPAGASMEAAIAAAAKKVLVSFYTNANALAAVNTRYDTQIAAIPDGAAKTAGITYGEAVAQTCLDLRANDGYNASSPYVPSNIPGRWRPTPPAFAVGLDPQWPNMTPFTMSGVSQYRTHQPPPLATSAYAFELNLVKAIGKSDSATRTADQTEIARFWADGGGTETPPGHWIKIASTLAVSKNLSAHAKARLMALTGLGVGDAGIISWDDKYAYDYWRPVTAIQLADTDGNASTDADPTWLPLITTPPFPEYTSGHSTFSRTAATVIARFFGTEDLPFTTNTDNPLLANVTRSFSGPGAAADESGISRIYGGIHFPTGNVAGQAGGYLLGTFVSDNFLVPLTSFQFSAMKMAGTGLTLQLNVTPGKTYRIQASTDLTTWEQIAIITSATSTAAFTDVNAPAGKRYYRAAEM